MENDPYWRNDSTHWDVNGKQVSLAPFKIRFHLPFLFQKTIIFLGPIKY
jgi:hypothetical protein